MENYKQQSSLMTEPPGPFCYSWLGLGKPSFPYWLRVTLIPGSWLALTSCLVVLAIPGWPCSTWSLTPQQASPGLFPGQRGENLDVKAAHGLGQRWDCILLAKVNPDTSQDWCNGKIGYLFDGTKPHGEGHRPSLECRICGHFMEQWITSRYSG